MSAPHFHVGEICYAAVPCSSGMQLIKCEITGRLKRRPIRDLDGNLMCYAMAYEVLLNHAVMEIPCAERDLRKRFEAGWWRDCVWQPRREAR